MENGFDYRNIPEEPRQDEQAQQPVQESAPEQPNPSGGYDYSYTPPREPEPAPENVPPAPKQKKQRSNKGLVITTSIVAGVMLILNLVLLISMASMKNNQTSLPNEDKTLDQQIAALEKDLQDLEDQLDSVGTPGYVSPSGEALTPRQVYAQNVQAVVAVNSEGVQTNFYGQVSRTASTGSGFIVSADGFVVTNYHVIEGGTDISVITYDEQEHKATVVGYDKTNDVAVLKMDGEDFSYVMLGSSDELRVGDQVMAIGNPLGELTSTLTVGYVSAKDRMVSTDGTAINMLQTDAAINSGNSGGPLFNAKGEVVGINTAKYSGTSSSGATIEGIGFAIPMDDVIGIIEDLQNKGYVSSTYLGVMVREVDTSAQSYGLPAGAYVEEVTPGYCAEAAGVQAKDIIIAIGEYKVDSMSALSRALRRFEAGEKTTITVYRAGQEVTMDITLDERPVEATVTEPEQEQTEPNNGGYTYPDIWDYFFGG